MATLSARSNLELSSRDVNTEVSVLAVKPPNADIRSKKTVKFRVGAWGRVLR